MTSVTVKLLKTKVDNANASGCTRHKGDGLNVKKCIGNDNSFVKCEFVDESRDRTVESRDRLLPVTNDSIAHLLPGPSLQGMGHTPASSKADAASKWIKLEDAGTSRMDLTAAAAIQQTTSLNTNGITKELPLACNPSGSLLELAYKLRWAQRNYGNGGRHIKRLHQFPGHPRLSLDGMEYPKAPDSSFMRLNLKAARKPMFLSPPMTTTDRVNLMHIMPLGRKQVSPSVMETALDRKLNGKGILRQSVASASPVKGEGNLWYKNVKSGLRVSSRDGTGPRSVQISSLAAVEDPLHSRSKLVNGAGVQMSETMVGTSFVEHDRPIVSQPMTRWPATVTVAEAAAEKDHAATVQTSKSGPTLWPILTSLKEITNWDYKPYLQQVTDNGKAENAATALGLNLKSVNDASQECAREELIEKQNDQFSCQNLLSKYENPGPTNDGRDTNLEPNPGSDGIHIDCNMKTKESYLEHMTKPLDQQELDTIQENAISLLIRSRSEKGPFKRMYQLLSTKPLQSSTGRSSGGQSSAADKGAAVSRKHRCSYCAYQTDNKSHLRRHLSSVHCIGMVYYCYICNKDFPRSEKVKLHFTRHHPEVEYDYRLVRKDKRPEELNRGRQSAVLSSETTPPMLIARPGLCRPAPVRDAVSGVGAMKDVPLAPLIANGEDIHMQSEQPLMANVAEEEDEEMREVSGMILECSRDSDTSPDDSFTSLAAQKGEDDVDDGSTASAAKDRRRKPVVCPICSHVARDIWHLKRHMADVHSHNRAHKCPYCDYATSRKHRLLSHMKSHGALVCVHCGAKVNSINELKMHLTVCPGSSFPCRHCNHTFKNRNVLQNHLLIVHRVHVHVCEACTFYTESEAQFMLHRLAHLHPGTRRKEYTCKECNEIFPSKDDLAEHQKGHTKTGSPKSDTRELLTCSLCGYKTKNRKVMECHLTRQHTGMDTLSQSPLAEPRHSQPGPSHEPQSLLNRENLQTLDDLEDGLECDSPGCDFKTSWLETLESHKNLWHSPVRVGKGTFICPICKDCRPPFRYKRSFDKHMEQHEQDSEKCPLCDKIYYFRHDLKKHLQVEHCADVEEVSTDEYSSDEMEPAGSAHKEKEESKTDMEGGIKTGGPQISKLAVSQGVSQQEPQIIDSAQGHVPNTQAAAGQSNAGSVSASTYSMFNLPDGDQPMEVPALHGEARDATPSQSAYSQDDLALQSGDRGDIVYLCPVCAKVFQSMSSFSSHLREEHQVYVAQTLTE